MIFAFVATAVLCAGCSDGMEPEGGESPGRAIGFSCATVESRAQETGAGNMASFRVSAVWKRGANDYVPYYMDEQLVKKDDYGVWTYSPVCYMPSRGAVNFFAYSPADALVSDFSIGSASYDRVSLTYDVTTDIQRQQDFMVAEAFDQTASSISLDFRHVLASVRVEALNVLGEAYVCRVREVKLLNLFRQGTLNGVAMDAGDGLKVMNWYWDVDSYVPKATYTIALDGYVDIPGDGTYYPVSDPAAGPLMVLPQTAELSNETNPDMFGTASFVAVTYDIFDNTDLTLIEEGRTLYMPLADPDVPGSGFRFRMGERYVLRLVLS